MVSQLKVNEIIKQSGSSITIGETGDTVSGPFTNVPAFYATVGSNQTISDNTQTKIAFDTEVLIPILLMILLTIVSQYQQVLQVNT